MVMCAKLWNTKLTFDNKYNIQCLSIREGSRDRPQAATTAFVTLLLKYVPTFEKGSAFMKLYSNLIERANTSATYAFSAALGAPMDPRGPCGPCCPYSRCGGCYEGRMGTVAAADVTPTATAAAAATRAATAAAEAEAEAEKAAAAADTTKARAIAARATADAAAAKAAEIAAKVSIVTAMCTTSSPFGKEVSGVTITGTTLLKPFV